MQNLGENLFKLPLSQNLWIQHRMELHKQNTANDVLGFINIKMHYSIKNILRELKRKS